jgi:hypothetical protein
MKAGLCFALLAVGAAAAGQLATVNEETAPVYSRQQLSEEKVVKSLKRGDVVSIEFSIAGEGGEWCAVSERDGRTRLGYMLCRHLRRDPVRAERVIPVSPQAAPSNAPNAPAVSGQRSPAKLDLAALIVEDYMRPIRGWATTFHFTAEQQAEVDDLANRTGVTECRRKYEAHARTYERELAMGMAPYLPKQITPAEQQQIRGMVQDLNRFLYPCQVKMLELLERFPGLMTPEQQSNAQAMAIFRKQLADQRRGLTAPDMSDNIR